MGRLIALILPQSKTTAAQKVRPWLMYGTGPLAVPEDFIPVVIDRIPAGNGRDIIGIRLADDGEGSTGTDARLLRTLLSPSTIERIRNR